MGGCKSKGLKAGSSGSNKLTLAILGLDNAGKTVTTKGLQGESLDTVAPTIGFSQVDFRFGKHDIVLFDLGGGKRIRDIWKNYFSEVYGVIYVIDSSDPDRMEECHSVLSGLLEHPKVSGKPVLVLANKQDKPGALDEMDICENLRLEELVNRNKCPCRLETCSAILGQGKKLDKPIVQGITWILTVINANYETYKSRIETDVSEQQQREKQEKKEKTERVARIREERDRKENAEATARGETARGSDAEDEVDGNPFQRLDYTTLKEKDERLKIEKKKQKELKKSQNLSDDESDKFNSYGRSRRLKQDSDEDEYVPTQRAINSSNRTSLGYDSDDDKSRLRKSNSLDPIGRSPSLSRRALDLESASPSLRKRNGLTPSYARDKENSDDEVPSKVSPWLKNRSPRPPEAGALGGYPRKYGDDSNDTDVLYNNRRSLAPLTPLSPLDPIDAEAKKKKKKKPKKNQTVPSLDGGDDNYSSSPKSFYSGGLDPIPSRTGTPPQGRSLLKASRSPRLERVDEPEEQESDYKSKWGLVDDLPDVAPSYSHKSRPNMDYDDDIMT